MSDIEKSGAQTLERGLDILWHFLDSANGTSSINEIVRQIGTPRSTAYRLVKVLRDRGIVEETGEEGSYRLGFRVLQFASGVTSYNVLRQTIRPYLEHLAGTTQETVILTVKKGGHSLCLDCVRSPQSIHLSAESGALMPLHAGASAKILLAFASEAEREQILTTPLQQFTPGTHMDATTIRRDLARIRRLGYAVTDSELDPDSTTVSVPLIDGKGNLVAGLSVGGPSFRMSKTKQQDIVRLLRTVATDISTKIFTADFTA